MMRLYRSVLHTDNFNNINRDIIITLSCIIVENNFVQTSIMPTRSKPFIMIRRIYLRRIY